MTHSVFSIIRSLVLAILCMGLVGCSEPSSGDLMILDRSARLPSGVRERSYGPVTLAVAGGVAPHSWHLTGGRLPPGLSLAEGTGAISGVPTAVGPSSFTVVVRDSEGRGQGADFTITIHSQHVVVSGQGFSLGGRSWFPYGVNYWPHYAVNPPSASGFSRPVPEYWMGGAFYDPAAIEGDLAAMESLGFNCISTQASLVPDTWSALTDFLNRCLAHNIRVFLAFPPANPVKPEFDGIDPERALETIVRTLRLDRHEAIFGYDIAWEPKLGLWSEQRARYDGAFSRFVAREYGGVARANAALGETLATTRDGLAAAVISHDLPVRAVAGQTYACNVVMRNAGSVPWTTAMPTPHYMGQVLGEGINAWSLVAAATPPGALGTFTLSYVAPTTPGRHRVTLSLVQLGVAWFGPLLEWEIEVVEQGTVVQRAIVPPDAVLGPEDGRLQSTMASALVGIYRRAMDTEVATRFARVTRRLRQLDPEHLISCRQGWGGNGSALHSKFYPLELYATAFHFDFLGPEGYEFMSTLDDDAICSATTTVEAYCRFASAGKPVYWTEAAFRSELDPTPAHLAEQALFTGTFLTQMLGSGSDGVAMWWWPGGTRNDENSDFGLTNQDRTLRPAAITMRSRASEATSSRRPASGSVPGRVDLFTDSRGFPGIYEAHRPAALTARRADQRYTMIGDGAATTSSDPPVVNAGLPKHLWAEVTKVELRVSKGDWFEVRDGFAYVVPPGAPVRVRAEVVNMGDTTWIGSGSGVRAAVAFAGNEVVGHRFRYFLPSDLPRMSRAVIPEITLTDGLAIDTPVQFQMLVQDVGWVTGSVRIDLIVSP